MARALALSAMILATGVIAWRASVSDPPSRPALQEFPRSVGAWSAVDDVPLDSASRAILRADDYLDRTYRGPSGSLVNLYVAYYASQRQGEAIHSPQNCLPGSGWQPIEARVETWQLDGRTIPVNRYVIEREGVRQLAYYWYQGRGRAVAGEVANKFWLVLDAVRLGRSDGALVRVMTTLTSATTGRGDDPGAAFTHTAYPTLASYIP